MISLIPDKIVRQFNRRNDDVLRFYPELKYFGNIINSWFRRSHEIVDNTVYYYAFPKAKVRVIETFTLEMHDITNLHVEYCPFRTSYKKGFSVKEMKKTGDPAIKFELKDFGTVAYYLTERRILIMHKVWERIKCSNFVEYKSIFRKMMDRFILDLRNNLFDGVEEIEPVTITLGADPEFEMLNDYGETVNAGEILEEIEPDVNYLSSTTEIGTDGCSYTLELRPNPSTEPSTLTNEMKKLIKKLNERYNGYVSVKGDEYAIGCHIHFGLGFCLRPDQKLLTLLDYFIGKHSIDLSGSARRQYRNLSAFETKSYGFEYRTPPAGILSNPRFFYLVLKTGKLIVSKYVKEKEFILDNSDKAVINDYVRLGLTEDEAVELLSFYSKRVPKGSVSHYWADVKLPVLPPVSIEYRDYWKPSMRERLDKLLAKYKGLKITIFGLKRDKGLCVSGINTGVDYIPTIQHQYNRAGDRIVIGLPYLYRAKEMDSVNRNLIEKGIIEFLNEVMEEY